jgi:hypothetical protein
MMMLCPDDSWLCTRITTYGIYVEAENENDL